MKTFLSACGFAITLASFAFAQSAPTSTPTGLDSLTDDRLLSELASRGLNSLLDRAFEVNRVPQAQRDGMRTLVALRQLSDPKLSGAQRRALVGRVVGGIETALASLTDPAAMSAQAN